MKVYVLTGSTARSKATDSELSDIIKDSKPKFAESLFNGLEYLIREIGYVKTL